MYERYWQLQRPAFRADAPGEFFFPGRSHQAGLLKLRYLVEHNQGAAVVIGAAGTGKTALLAAFTAELPAHVGPVVSVLFPQLTTVELLSYLASKLGIDDDLLDRPQIRTDAVLRLLETRLRELTQQGRRPVLILDDAELVDDRQVFQALQLLLNFRQPGRLEFSLVFAGQPELVGQIRRLHPLQERLAFTCGLHTLDEPETMAYVRHRLLAAGAAAEIFDNDALQTVYRLSGGVPRRINRLCDFALLVGYADNLRQICPAQVVAVAEELTTVAA